MNAVPNTTSVLLLCITALMAGACASGTPEPECIELARNVQLPESHAGQPADSVATRAASPTGTQADHALRLVLNIPAFTVRVLVGDSLLRAYQVAVGSPRYPTRTGNYVIRTITWNPWWNPPASEWAEGSKRTPPGPANPMGKVKINYTGAYYLHGTPDSARLLRAVSHGCVRMQNSDAIELALIIQRRTGQALPPAVQDHVLTSWQEQRVVELRTGVPIDVRYDIAEVRDSFVVLHRDIYGRVRHGRDNAVFDALATAGIASAAIDSAAVRAFVTAAEQGGSTSMRSLLRP